MIDGLITEQELCDWLRVSRSTIHNLRKRDLPFLKILNCVRYNIEDVQKWLENHQGSLEDAEQEYNNNDTEIKRDDEPIQ